MNFISTSNIKKNKPIIIHRLAKEVWGNSEKGLLSRNLIDDVINRVNSFVPQKLSSFSKDQLTATLIDYIRVLGYYINKWDYSDQHTFVTTYLNSPENIKSIGLATADFELTVDQVREIVTQNRGLEYYHVLSLIELKDKPQENVNIVADNITQLIGYIVIFDYFFDTYMYSILSMPGIKEYLNTQLKIKLNLTKELKNIFETGWESLRGHGRYNS